MDELPEYTIEDFCKDNGMTCAVCHKLPLHETWEDLAGFEDITLFNSQDSKLIFRQRDGVWWFWCYKCAKFLHLHCHNQEFTQAQLQQIYEGTLDFLCCKCQVPKFNLCW